jgi:hypothetical protein
MTQEKNKKQTALDLLDMIIEKAYLEDEEHKKKMIARHKGSKAVGISWMCFHLEVLKGLLEEGD